MRDPVSRHLRLLYVTPGYPSAPLGDSVGIQTQNDTKSRQCIRIRAPSSNTRHVLSLLTEFLISSIEYISQVPRVFFPPVVPPHNHVVDSRLLRQLCHITARGEEKAQARIKWITETPGQFPFSLIFSGRNPPKRKLPPNKSHGKSLPQIQYKARLYPKTKGTLSPHFAV